MTPADATLTAYLIDLGVAHTAAMRAQSLRPSNALGRAICLMAGCNGDAHAQLSPVTMQPMAEISPTGPRPCVCQNVHPAVVAGAVTGSRCEALGASAPETVAGTGAASAGIAQPPVPVPAPPADIEPAAKE